MAEISIIIPVYNASQHLADCLDSVLQQSFPNLEIICINDGSTDDSLQILQAYHQKHSRITIHDQKNAGVSAARNVGLAIAQGKYIGFVDSDDKIFPDYLTTLYNLIQNADLSLCGYIGNREMNYREGTVNLNTVHLKTFTELLDTGLLYPPWGKLYKTEIINKNQIKFEHNVNYGEDLLFNLQYLEEITEIEITSKILYNYNVLNKNSLANKYSLNRFENTNTQINKIGDFLMKLFTDKLTIGQYVSEKLYWNTYDACFYLQNNFHFMNKKERKIYINYMFDFPYFATKEKSKLKPHLLVTLFAHKNARMIYKYLYLRKIILKF